MVSTLRGFEIVLSCVRVCVHFIHPKNMTDTNRYRTHNCLGTHTHSHNRSRMHLVTNNKLIKSNTIPSSRKYTNKDDFMEYHPRVLLDKLIITIVYYVHALLKMDLK